MTHEELRPDESGPKIRDIPRLIEALEIVEAEFWFQLRRLKEHVRPRTEEESVYLADLEQGYRMAARYTHRLLKYHSGRMRRITESGTAAMPSMDHDEAIDDSGRAAAYLDTDDDHINDEE